MESRLNKYSKTVLADDKNIYNNQLSDLLASSNQPLSKNFKSNLDKIDIKTLIKPLPCSETNKHYCQTSETPSETEVEEFIEAFQNQTPNTKFLPSNYLNENQQIKHDRVKSRETSYSETKADRRKFNEEANPKSYTNCFKTARDELQTQNLKKYGHSSVAQNVPFIGMAAQKRKLGTRRNINSKFISPLLSNNDRYLFFSFRLILISCLFVSKFQYHLCFPMIK